MVRCRAGSRLTDGAEHAMRPSWAGDGVGWESEVVRLVAQVPGPHGDMVAQPAHDFSQQHLSRIQRHGVHPWVAVRASIEVAAADDLPPFGHWLHATQEPRRRPVGTAHVAGEERHVEAETTLGRHVGHDLQFGQCSRGHCRGCRREVLPQQEDAHQCHTQSGDDVELCGHLVAVEVLPPVHRLAARPVVDADREGLTDGQIGRAHAGTRSSSNTRAPKSPRCCDSQAWSSRNSPVAMRSSPPRSMTLARLTQSSASGQTLTA